MPTYCAAVLTLTFGFLRLKNDTLVTPALGNVHTNFVFYVF